LLKHLLVYFILFFLISCSNGDNTQDLKSSNFIKPNFTSIQTRYDCVLDKDKSLNNLEALIPSLVVSTKNSIPSASLEILFNQGSNIEYFSIIYSDKNMATDNQSFLNILVEEGLYQISNCSMSDIDLQSANIFIDNISLNPDSFEVEILNCEFNEGYNYGTFSIEIDTFLNALRSKEILYFAKFQQVNDLSSSFTWINYLGSEDDKNKLYEIWLEEEGSIRIQESFNTQSTCQSSSAYKGYKIL